MELSFECLFAFFAFYTLYVLTLILDNQGSFTAILWLEASEPKDGRMELSFGWPSDQLCILCQRHKVFC